MFNESTVLLQESPLAGIAGMLAPLAAGGSTAFGVTERPFLELVNVKGPAASEAMQGAVKSMTGAGLPLAPNTVSESADFTIFWLAPNEWLIQSKVARVPVIESELRRAFSAQFPDPFASAVDISSGNTSLLLSGEKVRLVLRKGCPLDLHSSVFAPGQCAQSHYFKAGILLRPLQGGSYEVVIRRSFADYFGRILLDAAQEFLV